jgi:hypothetical protein
VSPARHNLKSSLGGVFGDADIGLGGAWPRYVSGNRGRHSAIGLSLPILSRFREVERSLEPNPPPFPLYLGRPGECELLRVLPRTGTT